MKIGVIGAGHAGVAAAEAVAKQNIEVILFSNEKVLPYYRPGVPGVAFGQTSIGDVIMHPEKWYEENNIDLKLDSEVCEVTENCKVTTYDGIAYFFDKIIFAYGAGPIIPSFADKISSNKLIPLWSMSDAILIKNKIGRLKNMVIVGGGVIGLEAALRAAEAGFHVKVIEKNARLLARNLNSKVSEFLQEYLEKKNIEILTNTSVERIEEIETGLKIADDKAQSIITDFALISIGAKYDCSLVQNLNIAYGRRITVDKFLQSTRDNFFVAGDIVQLSDSHAECSALRAARQGKLGGVNSTLEHPEKEFEEIPITLQVKYRDFSLFAIGDPDIKSREEVLEKDMKNNVLRIVNFDKNNKVVGVQMLGSNLDFKKYKKVYSKS